MKNLHFYIGGRGYGKAHAILKRYDEATDIFNIRNKNKYKIALFLDLSFLNIILHDLINHKYYRIEISTTHIYDAPVGEIVNAFEELRDSIDEESGNIIIKVKGENNVSYRHD